MAKTKPAGEGKIGLILALTFFVITSIALGVFAYQFNGEVEGANTKVEDAKKNETKAKELLITEQKRVALYKAFAGVPLSDDEKRVLTGLQGTDPLRAEHQALMASTIAGLQSVATAEKLDFDPKDFLVWDWPANGTLPESPRSGSKVQPARTTTMPKESLRLLAAAERIRLQATAAKQNAEAAVASYNTAAADYAKAKELLDDARTATVKEKADVVKTIDAAKNAAAAAFVNESGDFRDKFGKAALARNQAEAEKRAVEQALQEKLQQLADLRRKDDAKLAVLPFDLPKGKVVSRRGNQVEINLGRADKLQTGVTFSVQPIDFTEKGEQSRLLPQYDNRGRPDRDSKGELVKSFQPKGKLVVTEVLGPNLSRALVTDEYDGTREPVSEGDLLYNASWQKGTSDHIVLFGIFDKDGDGTDDIKQVVAELKKAGVIVDGYWDLATSKWAGGAPTERTAYAIRGEYPLILPGAVGEGLAKERENLRTSLSAALTEAEKKGAKIISSRDYFPRVGYKVALGLTDDTINQAAAKYLQAAPPAAPPEMLK